MPTIRSGKRRQAYAYHCDYSRVLTFAIAIIAPLCYLFYVNHFAQNVLQFDDWSTVTLIHNALHGHLSWSQLWVQHNEARVFVPNVIYVAFGFINRFNLRAIIFLSAGMFIASYFVLLKLFREYLGRRLTPIPVLTVALVWFSLANVQNTFWAFQLAWFLVVICFVMMVYALLISNDRRNLGVVAAALAATCATLSFTAGIMLWPVGALCILWVRRWGRQRRVEVTIWTTAAFVTLVFYFFNFKFSDDGCGSGAFACSPDHPLATLRFFVVLIGNIIPGGYFGASLSPVRSFGRFELVGVTLIVVALFILVQSWRQRDAQERMPLPVVLITFALLFDAIVALGRSGALVDAVNDNRDVLPNILLLTGILMYVWARVPLNVGTSIKVPWSIQLSRFALVSFGIFLIVQIVVATGFGLNNARWTDAILTEQARLVVNLDRVPNQERNCELTDVIYLGIVPWTSVQAFQLRSAATDHLSQFSPASYRHYRNLGVPRLSPACSGKSALMGEQQRWNRSLKS
jgi:hypothetical protein